MSDFDDVLERLLTDPGFQHRLAVDPAGALAGYQLSADELELLRAQVGGAGDGQSQVEQRTSKASMFGLISSISSGIGDVVHGHGNPLGHSGPIGHAGPMHGGGSSHGIAAAGHEAARGLDEIAQGRHAVPDGGGGGLLSHVHGVGDHGGQLSVSAGVGGADVHAGNLTAHAGPDGAYISTGSGGLSEASDGSGSAGLSEAPESQGAGAHFSAHGTVYRSGNALPSDGLSSGLSEAPEGFSSSGLSEAGPGGVYVTGGQGTSSGLSEASVLSEGAGDSRHGLGSGLDHLSSAHGGAPAPPPTEYQGGHRGGLAGGLEHALPKNLPGSAPTDGYHTRVDWDGDGKWDQHTYVNRADGGVDIVVDVDGDGKAEFIGHDTDRDGLINSSDIDTNHDGVMDQHYEDLNGDGWLDRRTR